MSRFLVAVVRNCGVAIVISLFFAVTRGPSHPQPAIPALAVPSHAPVPDAIGGLARDPACDRINRTERAMANSMR